MCSTGACTKEILVVSGYVRVMANCVIFMDYIVMQNNSDKFYYY